MREGVLLVAKRNEEPPPMDIDSPVQILGFTTHPMRSSPTNEPAEDKNQKSEVYRPPVFGIKLALLIAHILVTSF
jgi:hypothetical protein